MKRKTIAILFGGKSSEYEVSLQSAAAIIKNFPQEKYDLYLIGITRAGQWFHYDGEIEKISNDTWNQELLNPVTVCLEPERQAVMEIVDNKIIYQQIDAVLPVLHGKNGEDGTVQGLMELAKIPVLGCGLLASALCMDKYRAHQLVKAAGIKVTRSVLVHNINDFNVKALNFPLFVKPLKVGSSYGISKVVKMEELTKALEYAFNYDNEVIVEEAVEGFEVGCAIIGNDELTVGEVDEIELSGGFFDYDEKYTLKTSTIYMPARIDEVTARKIQETAKIIYQTLACQNFARVDMFLTPNNEIVFNEVNTIPGFTDHSRFPQMMKGVGFEFSELIDKIVAIGLKYADGNFK